MESPPAQAAPTDGQEQSPVIEESVLGMVNGHDVEVDGVEEAVGELSLGQRPEGELHQACAEGRVEDVRRILIKDRDEMETPDKATQCTPIVLAIRNNQPDVVRELLQAGALVPPPSVTSDPHLLSLLYPQPMYGMHHQYMGQTTTFPQYFDSQQGFYPQGPQRGMYRPFPARMPSRERKDGTSAAQGPVANLPPTEVAKTIPCRNFPNCKYGNNCVFFHPGQPTPFFSGGHPYMSNGYDQGMNAVYQANGIPMQGSFYGMSPNGFNPSYLSHDFSISQHFQSPPNQNSYQHDSISPQSPADIPEHQITQHNHIHSHTQPQLVPSASAPAFVPSFVPGVQSEILSPPAPSQFGMSPLSPSDMASSLPSLPPPEVFFAAASPPNHSLMVGPPMIMGGPMLNGYTGSENPSFRRQSFGQGPYGMPPKPFGHGKKLSFSGAPRPFRSAFGGSGTPPPCAFFTQGKCRNGEFCKFPHLDETGKDRRHPDVISDALPPMPSSGRSRNMRMMPNGGFNPLEQAFRPQQPQQFDYSQQQRPGGVQGQQIDENSATDHVNIDESASPSSDVPDSENRIHPSVPLKPAQGLMPSMSRSASQPGVQRVHANGVISRSQSPAPSNVSFHGNGHPRRGGNSSRGPFPNGSTSDHRSSSAGKGSHPPQRVPGADEFPALGSLSSPGAPEKKDSSSVKTAAQVLSAPAPPKPVTSEPPSLNGEDKSGDEQSITMDSESEADAVIVMTKPSGGASPVRPKEVSLPTKRNSSVSFADVIPGIASESGLDSRIEVQA